MKKRIKIVDSLPVQDQAELKDFIGMEFDVVTTWKNKNYELETGQVVAVLKNAADPNIHNQPSILNKGEYIFI